MKSPIPNSYWVEPGRLLAGEYPGRIDDPQTPDRLKRLFKAGVDSFLDLTAPDELPGYQPMLPEGVRHLSHPLPDHSVPSSLEEMWRIQQALRAELDAGRCVYVHCRAGIGRTGITVGCYLRDGGLAPDEALEALNRLWQRNARSRRWPRVPETPEQEDFLLAWPGSLALAAATAPQPASRPVPQTPALAASAPAAQAAPSPGQDRQRRFRGCLVGLALGDALSLPAQGRQPGEFPPVTAPVADPDSDLPAGAWTDDTAMTLVAAASLLACNGFDAEDQVRQYLAWMRTGEPSATGATVGLRSGVREAITRASWRRGALGGSHDPARLDKEPLARCAAPAMYFHGNLVAAIEGGADCARVTHQAPLLVDACRLFTAMLHEALSGQDRERILSVHRRWPSLPLKEEILVLAEGWTRSGSAGRPLASNNILGLLDLVARTFRDVPAARDGLERVVNEGGDADAAGAAFGALAGAHFGETALPAAWRHVLLRVDQLGGAADQLAGRTVG